MYCGSGLTVEFRPDSQIQSALFLASTSSLAIKVTLILAWAGQDGIQHQSIDVPSRLRKSRVGRSSTQISSATMHCHAPNQIWIDTYQPTQVISGVLDSGPFY